MIRQHSVGSEMKALAKESPSWGIWATDVSYEQVFVSDILAR
jgi:hypothetical protein